MRHPFQAYSTILFVALSVSLFAQDPPANNTYLAATELTVQTGSCSTQTLGDLTHATNTNDMDYTSDCIATGYGYDEVAYADVWYKATVPASGNLMFRTSKVDGSSLYSTIMVAYTLNDGELTEIACDESSGYDGYSRIILTGQTENPVIYIMVVDQDEQFGYNTLLGSFNICVTDPTLPTNESYQTATALTVHEGSCSDQTQGNLADATDSTPSGGYTSTCLFSDYSNTDYFDLWYKATVPSSGDLVIETSAVEGSILESTIIVAFTLSDGELTEVGCDIMSKDDDFSKVTLSGLAENTVVYILVVEESDVIGGHYSAALGPFNICAYEPSALELLPPSNPLLSYYSNPVGNRLSVESPYHIQTLSVYDLSGREVLSQTPNKKQLQVSTYSLAPAVYLLRVQTSNGTQIVQLVKR